MKRYDISIAGEINLDLILYGLPEQMPTERELLASGFAATLGSSSAIVAHNAASLGARVCFQTLVGKDDFGRMALDRLRAAGVHVDETKEHPTLQTGITIMLPHGIDRHMLTYPGTIEALTSEHLDISVLAEAKHFHLSSLYLQRGLHKGLPQLLQQLKDSGLTISLDTNDDPADEWGSPLADVLPYVDCFMPNESEILRMTGADSVEEALQKLPESINIVVVKRGKRGATVRYQGETKDVPGLTVTPVDTIGAGDSFDAGFLVAWISGAHPFEAARAGNTTGALSTQGVGGTEAFRDAAKREKFLQHYDFATFVSSQHGTQV